MSPDTRFYVDTFTSSAQPPQVSLHAADGKLLAQLLENRLDSQHPDAPYLADNSVPEFGTLTAADGQTLYYRVFKPAHFDPAKHYPAIVDVYGGPGVQRVLDNWTGNSFTQILTRAGYVVFQLDNRGTAFRGTAFQAPIHDKLGDIEVADQVQGARWLAAQGYVDPARIGVWGWSYGGYMTLMLMFKAPDVFRAGVSGAPVTDWSLYDTHYTERYLDRPQDQCRRLCRQLRAALCQRSQGQTVGHARNGRRQCTIPAQHEAIPQAAGPGQTLRCDGLPGRKARTDTAT